MLFSATQSRNVEDLARVSLKRAPLYVGVDDHKETSTVDGLEQVCPPPAPRTEGWGLCRVGVACVEWVWLV